MAANEPNASTQQLTDMCVLLVEDDAVARKMAEAALKSCGYQVVAAENGQKALDVLSGPEGDSIDLILTDILMPEVNGLQLLDKVVATPKWRELPVTVMSTQDSIDNAANCIQKGAVEFLAKPVRKHKLESLWQHVLRRKAAKDDDPKQQAVKQELPKAIVEIAFNKPSVNVEQAVKDPLHHSNSCSAFSAFIRCRGGTNPANALHYMNENLHMNQAFRGSGMLTVPQPPQHLIAADNNIAASKRRAAAIQKFREKKKARNFKKKVRYESRKRLAEQRPRIKGQFVRPEVAAAAAAAAATAASAAAAVTSIKTG